jgi:hypothetical protein
MARPPRPIAHHSSARSCCLHSSLVPLPASAKPVSDLAELCAHVPAKISRKKSGPGDSLQLFKAALGDSAAAGGLEGPAGQAADGSEAEEHCACAGCCARLARQAALPATAPGGPPVSDALASTSAGCRAEGSLFESEGRGARPAI